MTHRSLPPLLALASLAVVAAAISAFARPPAAEPGPDAGPAIPTIPLAHEGSDLAPDPAVTWGLLDNGVRYAVMPNSEPPDRVSMRLYVDAGSLMETDDQQGLAHFLEHMAFNGTTHFPPGEMVGYFQRLGMGFGNHTNAHTTFHETVYKLELPNSTEEMLDEAMKLFRDYADGMLLLPDEIDDERGIILSEKRSRDSVDWRTFVEQIGFAFPDVRVSSRMPIGLEEVIREAQRERFVEFYENWYTPNRMAVVIVGDVEPEEASALVRKYFDDMPERERRPDPPMGEVSQRGFAAHYHHEPEAGETSVSIQAVNPLEPRPDTKARREEDLKHMLATRMISRRLERVAREEDSPIRSGSARAGDFFDLGFALYGSISADCASGDWQAALALVEQELRRALEFGFTESEFEEAKAVFQRSVEESAATMGTRQSRALADRIARQIGNRRVFTSPADDLPRVSEALASFTPETVHAAFRELWDAPSEVLVFVSGNVELGDDGLTLIQETFAESLAVAVEPPADLEIGEFAYGELPEPGAVAERRDIEDLGVVQLRFENQVRANLKVTDFEDDTVYVNIRFGAGLLTEPEPGLSLLLSGAFVSGGLEAHSQDDLQRLFAGQSVNVAFSVDDDAFSLTGRTTPDHLEAQLKLMRAYLTAPGYRSEALVEFRRSLDALYQQLERTPGGFAQYVVSPLLRSGDSRFGYPPREVVEALDFERASAWLQPDLESGYFEVTVLGDFDEEAAIAALASAFGSLPERDEAKPDYAEERRVAFPEGGKHRFEFDSAIPKGMVSVHWPTEAIFDIERTRRIGMLGAILDDRLRVKIREELGDAYSPFAHNLPSDTWTDFGYLFASITVDPEQAESVAAVVSEIAAELATGASIDEDELERAKRPQITQIEEMRRTNRYWMNSVLQASQEYPQRLEWARTFVDDYREISVENVNELAQTYLVPDRELTVLLIPAPDSEGASAAAEVAAED